MLDGDWYNMPVCSFSIEVVIRLGAEEVMYDVTGSTPNQALNHTIIIVFENTLCINSCHGQKLVQSKRTNRTLNPELTHRLTNRWQYKLITTTEQYEISIQ